MAKYDNVRQIVSECSGPLIDKLQKKFVKAEEQNRLKKANHWQELREAVEQVVEEIDSKLGGLEVSEAVSKISFGDRLKDRLQQLNDEDALKNAKKNRELLLQLMPIVQQLAHWNANATMLVPPAAPQPDAIERAVERVRVRDDMRRILANYINTDEDMEDTLNSLVGIAEGKSRSKTLKTGHGQPIGVDGSGMFQVMEHNPTPPEEGAWTVGQIECSSPMNQFAPDLAIIQCERFVIRPGQEREYCYWKTDGTWSENQQEARVFSKVEQPHALEKAKAGDQPNGYNAPYLQEYKRPESSLHREV